MCVKCEFVEGEKFHSILGVKDCQMLGLIEVKDSDAINPLPADSRSESLRHTLSEMEVMKETVKKKYPSVFQDKVGYIGDYAIKVDANVSPVQHAPRQVPVALHDKLRAELKELQEQGILIPVKEPIQWISSMVAIVKKSSLRICLDPKDLNRAVLHEHYQLPTIEDISSQLAGMRLFTLLDVSSNVRDYGAPQLIQPL